MYTSSQVSAPAKPSSFCSAGNDSQNSEAQVEVMAADGGRCGGRSPASFPPFCRPGGIASGEFLTVSSHLTTPVPVRTEMPVSLSTILFFLLLLDPGERMRTVHWTRGAQLPDIRVYRDGLPSLPLPTYSVYLPRSLQTAPPTSTVSTRTRTYELTGGGSR